ncbi:hypothetical protein [Thiothrix nivea]|uniref:Uncharacterized protein n=1 Tax=Thiothrix nivea (strain ATCC 35100 / DSM 5205 / JP2) TaxID=870187 RepID=A0A656HEV9_THINJ|nr:hypothetical protein [Thiothrix nivea]EIJ35621.1 hypothetical protein Thini_3097 [Thiothrix nivea DSM 5205]
MNMPTSHRIIMTLMAVALPGGVFLLLFPKQTSYLMSDVKDRIGKFQTFMKK